MKYTIATNQLAWVKYFQDADLSHMIIYDVISGICNWHKGNKLERTKDGYTWITLGLILQEAPKMSISSKPSVSQKVKYLEEKGILLTTRKGDKKYFKVSDWAFEHLAIPSSNKLPKKIVSTQTIWPVKPFDTSNRLVGQNDNTTILSTNRKHAASSIPLPGGDACKQHAVPLYSKGVETEKKKKEFCLICKKNTIRWRTKNSPTRKKWLCSVCHPPIARKEQIEWQLEEEKTPAPFVEEAEVFSTDKIEETLPQEIEAVKKAIIPEQPEDSFDDWTESLDNVDYTITIPADSMECRFQIDSRSESEPEPIANSLGKILTKLKPRTRIKEAIQKYNIEEAKKFGVYTSEPIIQDGIIFEHVKKTGKSDADCIDTVKLIGDKADILKVIRGKNKQEEPISLTEDEIKKIDRKMTNHCRRITLPTIAQFRAKKYWLVQRLKDIGDGTSQITLQEV